MTKKRKSRRSSTGTTPQQLYLHHIEEAATHLAAAKAIAATEDGPAYTHLCRIGEHMAKLYRRAGGNPDATR